MIQIRHRLTHDVLFEGDCEDVRDCVIAASKARADLAGADLSGADLAGASLAGASLAGADLTRADLTRADLAGARFAGADLTRADLAGASLAGASLAGADLAGASLADASLAGADLTGASLTCADLTRADLAGASLAGADLTPIRDDLWAVLSAAPAEVDGLRAAIAAGRVDGSTYDGDCACLVGTIAHIRGVAYTDLGVIQPNSARPAERFFLIVRRGDTPDRCDAARIAMEWIDQWLAAMRAAFGGRAA
jgi:hypothetical protein